MTLNVTDTIAKVIVRMAATTSIANTQVINVSYNCTQLGKLTDSCSDCVYNNVLRGLDPVTARAKCNTMFSCVCAMDEVDISQELYLDFKLLTNTEDNRKKFIEFFKQEMLLYLVQHQTDMNDPRKYIDEDGKWKLSQTDEDTLNEMYEMITSNTVKETMTTNMNIISVQLDGPGQIVRTRINQSLRIISKIFQGNADIQSASNSIRQEFIKLQEAVSQELISSLLMTIIWIIVLVILGLVSAYIAKQIITILNRTSQIISNVI